MDGKGKTAGLVKIPDDIPLEQASFIEPVNTCYKAVRLLGLKADETVLVIGQGPIGILLAALARRTGATVLTSDLMRSGTRLRRSLGWTGQSSPRKTGRGAMWWPRQRLRRRDAARTWP